MNTQALARRIDRLEHEKTISHTKINIFCAVYQKWIVPRDFTEYDTLQQAIDHVKAKYHTRHIIVGQMAYIMQRMTDKQLDKVEQLLDPVGYNEKYKYLPEIPKVPTKTKGINDPFFDQFKKPCKPLRQAMKDNPDVEFQLGEYDTEKYWHDYQEQHTSRKIKY